MEKGVTPQEHVDEIVEWIKGLWKILDIDYDIFIRTTDDYHQKAVQQIFKNYMIRVISIKAIMTGYTVLRAKHFLMRGI